jgi:hypothetical protein
MATSYMKKTPPPKRPVGLTRDAIGDEEHEIQGNPANMQATTPQVKSLGIDHAIAKVEGSGQALAASCASCPARRNRSENGRARRPVEPACMNDIKLVRGVSNTF